MFQSFVFSYPFQLVFDGFLLIKFPTCLLSAYFQGSVFHCKNISEQKIPSPCFTPPDSTFFHFPFRATYPCLPACPVLWEAWFGVCTSWDPSRCWLVWFNQREEGGRGLRPRVLFLCVLGCGRAVAALAPQRLFPTATAAARVHADCNNSPSKCLIRPAVPWLPILP